ncbi:hypothetical protein B0H94_1067 [Salsuginibacillus halophilus]|uniref:Uncharacterized protein n=1 Tax=Salsuginibacillus halophilus TaxID=517424 RepID=A0A2P8HHP6_9BACI|nr:hypothetical protein [Salsuginibacillus halophilus]PSL45752.1 hypothetical protein B0H94_1067 [Salsuginibacillus halophilus]
MIPFDALDVKVMPEDIEPEAWNRCFRELMAYVETKTEWRNSEGRRIDALVRCNDYQLIVKMQHLFATDYLIAYRSPYPEDYHPLLVIHAAAESDGTLYTPDLMAVANMIALQFPGLIEMDLPENHT